LIFVDFCCWKIQLEEVANKTMHVFAPELFAEEPLAKDSTSLAFLLKVGVIIDQITKLLKVGLIID
jgi:hypothetical protein